jgi:hypothetical protein
LSTRRRIYLLVLDAASTAPVPVPVEQWPELRELVPGRLADLAPEGLGAAFVGAFAGVLPGPARFLATPWDPAYPAGRSTTMEELWAQYRGRGRLDRWWPPPGG